MKHIYTYIIEALHINKNTTSKTYSFFPKNKNIENEYGIFYSRTF